MAVAAAASTTAWATMGNDDSPKPAAALTPPSPAAKTTRSPEPTSARTAEKPPASATQPKPTTSAGSTPTHRNSPNHPGTAASSKPTTTSQTQAEGPSSTDRPSSADQDSSTGDRSSSAEQQSKSRPAKSKPTKPKPTKPKLRVLSSGTCGASYYGEPQMTASGERFSPHAMTAAHKTLPLGSRVRVTNPRTGESVTVRINDRGPYIGGRCLDLSTAAFAAIGNTSAGVMRVRYEVLAR
ncbi:septal ring lytic transglycosylase RlpA family protein [Nonomuraea sp. NPDC049421]|uniref:septal ring lytic transglycosylase RlpA family protein n=1 Tax=Nonomuraea sp. NPDC049421 TaxID=3155275 RepID=UPI00342F0510